MQCGHGTAAAETAVRRERLLHHRRDHRYARPAVRVTVSGRRPLPVTAALSTSPSMSMRRGCRGWFARAVRLDGAGATARPLRRSVVWCVCRGPLVHGCVVAASVWTIGWRRIVVEWHAMSGDCVAGDGTATSAVVLACVPCAVSVRGCRAAAARLCRDDPAVSCSCPCVSL
jgi:hypothetical protein